MSTTKNRIQIVNWRSHGDDENYCYFAAYGRNDATTAHAEIQKQVDENYDWEHNEDPESQEDFDHVIYVNDDYVISNGDVVEHNGRKFRVSISEVKK
jgi:hypothetical protein